MGKTVPEFPYASHPVCFIMNIWHYYSTFVLINEPMLIHHYLQSMLYSYPPSFHLISLFFSVPRSQKPKFIYLASWGSTWLWERLQLPLFSMPLAVLRSIGQAYRKTPHLGICVMFSSWFYWGYGFLEDHRSSVLFLSHPMKGLICQHDLSLPVLTLTTCWGHVCQGSLLKSYSFSPFLYCAIWKEVLCADAS